MRQLAAWKDTRELHGVGRLRPVRLNAMHVVLWNRKPVSNPVQLPHQ